MSLQSSLLTILITLYTIPNDILNATEVVSLKIKDIVLDKQHKYWECLLFSFFCHYFYHTTRSSAMQYFMHPSYLLVTDEPFAKAEDSEEFSNPTPIMTRLCSQWLVYCDAQLYQCTSVASMIITWLKLIRSKRMDTLSDQTEISDFSNQLI
jgi:hypothetical protein